MPRTTYVDAATPPPIAGEAPADRRSPDPEPRGHIGWIVAGSLASGLVAALLLVAAPFIPSTEAGVTGALLCGLAMGWAMLTVLSRRFTDQPQPWAAVPALFMGLSGLLLVAFGSSVHEVLTWVWSPALLALVTWMVVRVRLHCTAQAEAGCSTPCSRCLRSPPSAAATRPSVKRWMSAPPPGRVS